MINYWQTVYWGFDTMSLTENVSPANVSPALFSSENIKLFNQATFCWVKKTISYHLDLTCYNHDQAWRLEIFDDRTGLTTTVTQPMSLLCCSLGVNVLSTVCFFFLCVTDVSTMLSCLKVKDTSAIGILVFELFIFLQSWMAQLHRKQRYTWFRRQRT